MISYLTWRQKWNRTLFLENYYVIIYAQRLRKKGSKEEKEIMQYNQCKGYKENESQVTDFWQIS